jgi:hypothetical protein
MNLSEFLIFLLQGLAFRWFIFDYKKLEILRKFVLRGFLAELAICTFCQGFEAGLFIYLLNIKYLPFNQFLFTWPLVTGFLAMVLEPFFQSQILMLEKLKGFYFIHEHGNISNQSHN